MRGMREFLIFVSCMVAGPAAVFHSDVLAAEKHVYSGQSIQAAIDTAVNGDVIVVHEGIYVGNIDFLGKAITVRSTEPDNPAVADATVIDGNCAGNVVIFANGEGNDSVLSGITIQNGMSGGSGGGILCRSSSPIIANCTVKENYARDGAGISCEKASPIITNCAIWGNWANRNGGGFYSDPESSPVIANCTISNNEVACYDLGNGGGMFIAGHSAMAINCIIWGNRPNEIDATGHLATYSDIPGDYPGTGNICVDPMFADPENGDYSLMPDSPCINKGAIRAVQIVAVAGTGSCLKAAKSSAEDHNAYEAGTVAGYFVFYRDVVTNSSSDVTYSVSGTADKNDYHALSGRTAIPAGKSEVQVYVVPYEDNYNEGTETVVLTYTCKGVSKKLSLNIYDNDSEVTITATDATASESGSDKGKFTVKRSLFSWDVCKALTVDYKVGGLAINGTDYVKLPGSVTIGAGKSSADITVTPKDDLSRETKEEVKVQLLETTPSRYKVGSPSNATVTIIDNDVPMVSVHAYNTVVKEGDGTKPRFQFNRGGDLTCSLAVWFYFSGSASCGTDYTYPGLYTYSLPWLLLPSFEKQFIIIPRMSSYVYIDITIVNDSEREFNETIECKLSTDPSYALNNVSSANSATVTIKDDEKPPLPSWWPK